MPDCYQAASLMTPHILSVTSENSQGASGRVLGVVLCRQEKFVDNPWTFLKCKSFHRDDGSSIRA